MVAPGSAPTAKRSLQDVSGPLSGFLFAPDTVERLRKSFEAAKPYAHLAISDVCDRERLIAARHELIQNVDVTPKETDLFKVYQTGDLVNIDRIEPELAARLPELLRIRNALYSPDFRAFVEKITGLPEGALIDKVDCSSNCYAHGGHLLCHDDVISTRRVSYILYLTDPDTTWLEEDGGALELYGLQDGKLGCPETTPTACLLPHFNSMALFTVQPGRSFHAVQEVYTDDPAKPRLSISGWFHGTEPPAGAESASLRLLKAGPSGREGFTPCEQDGTADASMGLSAADRAALAEWLSPTYLERSSLRKLVAEWERSSSVQLRGFLRAEVAAQIRDALRSADARDQLGNGCVPEYAAGVRDGWDLCGPCHMQRFLRHPGAPGSSCPLAELLQRVDSRLLRSRPFARWLSLVTDLAPTEVRSALRRFRPGLDYTVAVGAPGDAPPMLEATLGFVLEEDEAAAAAWASDDLGGYQCYMLAADEAPEAAETYRAETDDDAVISCSASFNTMHILLRESNLLQFIKYVGHDAPSSRVDVAVEYVPDLSVQEVKAAEEGGGR